MSTFRVGDDGIHAAEVANASWRDTWEYDWFDVGARAGGGCRVVSRDTAGTWDVHWWAVVDGRVVEDVRDVVHLSGLSVGQPLDADLGPVALYAVSPLQSALVTSSGGSALTFTAFGDPVSFSLSGQQVVPEDRHYEWPGTVLGSLRVAGRTVEVSALAFHRHTWGVPSAPPIGVLRAVADDDVFVAITWHRTLDGRLAPLGYIHVGDEFHGVEKARLRLDRGPDGMLRGCDLLAATADRRDFRVLGTVIAAPDGGTPALAEFTVGSLRAGGLLLAGSACGG